MAEYLKKAAPPEAQDVKRIEDTVRTILDDIQSKGEPAVREFSRKFDNWDPPTFRVDQATIDAASESVSDELAEAIHFARDQIQKVCPTSIGKHARIRD